MVTGLALAAAAWLLRDATSGRDYPWLVGRVFWGAMLFWFGVLRLRTGVAIFTSGRTAGAGLRFAGTALNRLTILALCWAPGLILGWYAIEAPNRPSRNSRGQDICDVSPAQVCVSGPRALIPWAVILLVFAGLASYYFIWSWTKAKRRDRAPYVPPASAARQRVEAVIPANEPASAVTVTVPGGADKDLSQGLKDLRELMQMKRDGELTPAEFEALKAEIVKRATDGA